MLAASHDATTFVAAVLADLPETPPYFARMKRVNQEGPALLDDKRPALPAIRPAAAAALAADGAIILDLRDGRRVRRRASRTAR